MKTRDDLFLEELTTLINKCNMERHSNTPGFILAEYALSCLRAFGKAICSRERWYGRSPEIGTTLKAKGKREKAK